MKRAERRELERKRQKAAPRRLVPAPVPADLRVGINTPGQTHVDDPRLRTVAIYGGVAPETATVAVGYTRTRLRWKRPVFDGAGNCVGFTSA